VIAGLTSGTFYPLPKPCALRNIPLRYLRSYRVALYATCVEGAVILRLSLYGSTGSIFRGNGCLDLAVITPVDDGMHLFGIPESPKPQNSRLRRASLGFFYASAGFALVFAALDQGQRLDWWRSGVFTALFIVEHSC